MKTIKHENEIYQYLHMGTLKTILNNLKRKVYDEGTFFTQTVFLKICDRNNCEVYVPKKYYCIINKKMKKDWDKRHRRLFI
jgi:hypothetical protein